MASTFLLNSGIALVYGLDDRGFETRQGLGIFLITASRLALATISPSLLSSGYQGLFPWGKIGRVPRSRMSGAILLLPQYAFMAWCSVKAQGQLYFYLTD